MVCSDGISCENTSNLIMGENFLLITVLVLTRLQRVTTRGGKYMLSLSGGNPACPQCYFSGNEKTHVPMQCKLQLILVQIPTNVTTFPSSSNMFQYSENSRSTSWVCSLSIFTKCVSLLHTVGLHYYGIYSPKNMQEI